MTIRFRVNAGKETGYGHVIRCRALANEIRLRGSDCWFHGNAAMRATLSDHHFHYCAPFELLSADVWIVDLEGGCPPALAKELRERCDVLVILNGVGYPDGDQARFYADLVFYQGRTEQPRQVKWGRFCGEWFEGPDWLILRREFSRTRAEPGTHEPPRVVVAGGGSDPKNVTQLAVDALARAPYAVRVIVGPANTNGLEFNAYNMPNMEVIKEPKSMAEALAWADMAIVSYGMTAFECMALGLPTIALSISADHAASAELVAEESNGGLCSLGVVEGVKPDSLRGAVDGLMYWRATYGECARQYVDGVGAKRVADKIMEVVGG